jgi:hypothetical protein
VKLLFGIVVCVLVFQGKANTQQISVEVNYLFTLGEGIGFGEPGYLFQPHRIATDADGNIFVSDRRQRMIFKYGPNGSFVEQIGRTGRGPGELNEITALAVDDENRLLVLDRMQFKVARFDLSIGDVEEHHFEDIRQFNMMTLQALPEDRFAGIYVETPFPGGEDMIDDGSIRVYEFGVGRKSSSFFDYFTHQFDKNVTIEEHLGRGIGHKLSVLNYEYLVAGHHVYFGVHNVVDLNSGDVLRLENPEIQPPYYADIGPDERPESFEDRYAGSVMSSGLSGSFYYQMLYMTMTLSGINGQLLHIYRKNEKRGHNFRDYLEVFDLSSGLVFHGHISNILPQGDSVTTRLYAHIDDRQRLFVVDYFEEQDPEVRVYRIDLDGL